MRILLKSYRMLTYIFLVLLVVGIGLSTYEYFVEKQDYGWTGILVNGVIIYLFFTFLYYLNKTKNMYLLSSSEISESRNSISFKFDKLTGISNFVIGLAITAFPIFIFLKYPINKLDNQEILRISLLLLVGAYGVLKINYTTRTLKTLFDLGEKSLE